MQRYSEGTPRRVIAAIVTGISQMVHVGILLVHSIAN